MLGVNNEENCIEKYKLTFQKVVFPIVSSLTESGESVDREVSVAPG